MTTRARDAGPLAREIDHTADVGLEIEAPTLPLLFERAGLAVLACMLPLATVEPRESVAFEVTAPDTDELLHDWLQALVVQVQAHGFVACELTATVGAGVVCGVAVGERLDPARHHLEREVKGITHHGLAVEQRPGGLRARVILDV